MTTSSQRRLARWTGALLHGLLPPYCVLCGMPATGATVCAGCRAGLPRPGRVCSICALPANVEPGGACGGCLVRPPPWDRCVSALDYRFPARHLVLRFKFNRSLACGALLAEELLRALRLRGGDRPHAIVPVPLHRSRQFARSFNQAELLARALAAGLCLPLESGLLLRMRQTRAQSGLDAVDRKKNTRGAFVCRAAGRSDAALSSGHPLKGSHLALVDDVMTTGATLRECVRVLRQAGVGRVTVWTAARATGPRERVARPAIRESGRSPPPGSGRASRQR